MLRPEILPIDDWCIRNHFLLNHTLQDSNSSWILVWGDEQTERALRRKFPKLRKLKKAFLEFVNKQKNIYKSICTFPITTVGVGDPNEPSIEATFRVWNTNFENWCLEGPIKQETWDRLIVFDLCDVSWNNIRTSALVFCIC